MGPTLGPWRETPKGGGLWQIQGNRLWEVRAMMGKAHTEGEGPRSPREEYVRPVRRGAGGIDINALEAFLGSQNAQGGSKFAYKFTGGDTDQRRMEKKSLVVAYMYPFDRGLSY